MSNAVSAYTPFQSALRQVVIDGDTVIKDPFFDPRTYPHYERLLENVGKFTPYPNPPYAVAVEILNLFHATKSNFDQFFAQTSYKVFEVTMLVRPVVKLVLEYLEGEHRGAEKPELVGLNNLETIKMGMILVNLENPHSSLQTAVYTSFQLRLQSVAVNAIQLYGMTRALQYDYDEDEKMVQKYTSIDDGSKNLADRIDKFMPYPVASKEVEDEALALLGADGIVKDIQEFPRKKMYVNTLEAENWRSRVFPQETALQRISVQMLLVTLKAANKV